MKRIGLTQRVEVIADYGERRDCLDQSWFTLMIKLGFTPIALPNINDKDAIEPYLKALCLDGVILTGGNDLIWTEGPQAAAERDHFEGMLIDYCMAHDVPILGVCRGMQMLNVHLGGELIQLDGHVTKNHSVTLSGGNCYQVNSYHNWGISSAVLSKKLIAKGWSEDGMVEYCTNEKHAIKAMMWHPERANVDSDIGIEIIKETFK